MSKNIMGSAKYVKKATLWIVVGITFLFAIDIFVSNIDNRNPNDGSFYYRDCIRLSTLIGNSFSNIKIADTVTPYMIRDNSLFFAKPEEISVECLKDTITLDVDGEIVRRQLSWRCWRDHQYHLKEITNNLWLKRTKTNYIINKIHRRLAGNHYNTIIATINDTTYFVENNILKWKTVNANGQLGKVGIISSVNNQMIKEGDLLFIRSANLLSFSKDGGKHFAVIYQGQDCKKESIVWDKGCSSLLISEYNTDGLRCHLLKYSLPSAILDTLITFHTDKEHEQQGLIPFCRHIHVLSLDPYTSQIWLGTGDSDSASGIYVADSSYVLNRIGGGSQMWRTLSFIYKKNNIYWASDCSKPQFICKASREAIAQGLKDENISCYPIFNSAV